MIRILQHDNRFIKVVFAVIIGFALVAMVITLVPGIFDNVNASGDPNVYATVHTPGFLGRFGDAVPVSQIAINREAQQQLARSGYPASPVILQYLEGRIAPQYIQRAILKLEADKMGLQVTDDDLRKQLQTGEIGQILYPNGKFIGDEKYIDFVQSNVGGSVADFEKDFKDRMEISRMYALITSGVAVSDSAVRESYRVSGTKIKFDYAVVNSDALSKNINPTDADLQTFFKQNQARYATAVPETRKLNYFTFGVDQLPGGVPQASDADLQAYYNGHLASYQVKDQAKVRHILIAVPAGSDAKVDAAARSKAEDLLKQIKAGGNFGELATKNSDDPGSKGSGGELGFLSPGQTVPEFDKASFSLKPGEVSDVIKTKFGYHILQVEERTNAHTKSLAEVKADILPIVQQQKAATAEQAYASSLADEAKKNGLDKTRAAHGLHATTTDYVAKDGVIPGVTDSTNLLTDAFSATKGSAPASVSTGDGYAVYQVLDVLAPHSPTFDAYRSHIQDDYRAEQVPLLLNAQLNKLDNRAKELGSISKAAAELNLTVKSSDLVGKDGQVPDVGAMTGPAAGAFSLNKGAVSGPINLGTSGVVLQITDKQEPSADEVAKNFASTREQMVNAQRDEFFQLYLGTLTQKYQKAGAIRLSKGTAAPPLGG